MVATDRTLPIGDVGCPGARLLLEQTKRNACGNTSARDSEKESCGEKMDEIQTYFILMRRAYQTVVPKETRRAKGDHRRLTKPLPALHSSLLYPLATPSLLVEILPRSVPWDDTSPAQKVPCTWAFGTHF